MKSVVWYIVGCLLLNVYTLYCPVNGTVSSMEQMSIGIEPQQRADIAVALNQLLSDEYVLYVKTQKYHWNVVGPFFGQLHALFNDQYEKLAEHIDALAERIRALGAKAYGTLSEFSEYSSLKEQKSVNPEALTMIKNLLQDHETIIRSVQEKIKYVSERNDVGTVNFLEELITKHQKMAWMLRAHLQ